MKHMRCNACSVKWSGSDTYCPQCGSPALKRHRIPVFELIWVTAAVLLIIFLTRSK